jgi:hypothetical protein
MNYRLPIITTVNGVLRPNQSLQGRRPEQKGPGLDIAVFAATFLRDLSTSLCCLCGACKPEALLPVETPGQDPGVQ